MKRLLLIGALLLCGCGPENRTDSLEVISQQAHRARVREQNDTWHSRVLIIAGIATVAVLIGIGIGKD